MGPRELRLLKELVEHDRVFVRDLRKSVGALNPAQIAFCLRKQGWVINTDFITTRDRDGMICHPGYYWLDDKEKQRAEEELRKAGAVGPAPTEGKCSELSDSQPAKGEDITRGQYDQPLD
jgi:hypothetical protein